MPRLFVARQLAQSGMQDKMFTCPSGYSLVLGKRASVKLQSLQHLGKNYVKSAVTMSKFN
jgi:hypothetical protein